MIDLALLCNLYADGPTTLGRLRELGCESLEAVEALSTQDLGWALQADDEVCARFRREAGLLRERRGSSKARETRSGATPTTGSIASSAASSTGAPATDGAPGDDRAGDDGANAKREGSLLDVLLRAWRRASGRGDDEREPRSTGAESAGAESTGVDPARSDAPGAVAREAAPTYELDPAPTPGAPAPDPTRSATTSGATPASPPAPRTPEPQVELPRPAPPESPSAFATSSTAPAPTAPAPAAAPIAAGTPLGDVGFEGIEAEYAEQLGDLGIVSVEDFLAAQPLDLAGRSTMRYTVLLRMQFTARRELSGSR